jgi:hypothetical protein
MLKSLVFALSLSLMAGLTAQAQTARTRTPIAPAPLDAQNLQAAMIAAQAAAIKPGDEALGCDALQRELVTAMNDPSIQAYTARSDAAYARELAIREKTKAPMTAEAAAALVASLSPGMTMAGLSGVPGQPVNAAQMQQAMLAQMQQLAVIMPVLMRSQRVMQLSYVKSCTWITGGLGLYPGPVVPRTVAPAR